MNKFVKILKELTESLELKLVIDLVIDNLDGTYKLECKHTHYLTIGFDLVLSGETYQIVDFANNEYLIIKGDVLPIAGEYDLPTPYFFSGTITQQNTELSLIGNTFQKTPMVYLRRTFEEKVFMNMGYDREANLSIFFLTQAMFSEWQTSDFDERSLTPMINLSNSFIKAIEDNRQMIIKDNEYEIIEQIKFATYTDQKGFDNSIWNDHLSGVQLNVLLTLFKTGCDCDC